MRLLLDTHIILWAMNDNPKLSQDAKNLIKDDTNEVFYSTASVWEVQIKHMSRPDKMKTDGMQLSQTCQNMGFLMLPICDNHVFLLNSLQRSADFPEHNDPLDRILLAQAKAEGMFFMTHDSKIPGYHEDCVLLV